MKQLEAMLHICFEDYRVVKEYDYRKNITTEWFDVNDIDVFNERIDKFTELMSIYGTKEIDVSRSIDSDTTMTSEEKEQTKENIGRAKGSNLKVEIDGQDISDVNARTGFINFVKKVIEKNSESIVSDDFSEFIKFDSTLFPSYARGTEQIGNIYLRTHCDTKQKKSIIDKMIVKYSLNGSVSIIQ
jgi:peptidoglycan hydrolase-like amidase